jgi:4-amino-4-deoxy-L-arabinose transferase-like glycosyltransferase
MMSRVNLLSLAIICAAAFLTIALLSDYIFEHVPHSEDEVAYIFQAKVFAQNRLSVPTPPLDDAFWSPFVLDYQGQRFGKYPPGWPALLSLGYRLNAPWLINALLGVLTLALVAWLGYIFYCSGQKACVIPVIAAGLGLVTPGFLFQSASFLSHSTSLFWNTLALIALFYAITHPPRVQAWPAILTGLFLGAAFLTRPFAGLSIGLALAIFLLVFVAKRQLKWTIFLWIAAGGLPIVALLPLYWAAITGDPTFNAYLLVWPYDRIGFGPDIGPYGYTLRTAIFINTRLKLLTLATGLFGWPGWSSLLFLPIPFIVRRATRWDWLLLAAILSIIFTHIFYWSFGGADGGLPRYYYDALPAFLLLTARGIEIGYDYLNRWRLPWRSRQLRLGWIMPYFVGVFIAYNFVWNLPPLLAAQKGKYNITPAPLRIVEEAHVPKPALILVKNVDTWSDFAVPFVANSPTLDGGIVYATDATPALTRQVRTLFSNRTCWELYSTWLQLCPAFENNP